MSILGKWFKKDQQKRLDDQTEKGADVEVDENPSNTTPSDVKVVSPAKSTKADTEKKETKKTKKTTGTKDKQKISKKAPISPILLKPHITEKAAENQSHGIYTFVVARDTSKNEIAKAIKRTYNVTPNKIRVINMRGKSVRWGRNTGQRNHWKKAMVYLKKGDTMVIHEGT